MLLCLGPSLNSSLVTLIPLFPTTVIWALRSRSGGVPLATVPLIVSPRRTFPATGALHRLRGHHWNHLLLQVRWRNAGWWPWPSFLFGSRMLWPKLQLPLGRDRHTLLFLRFWHPLFLLKILFCDALWLLLFFFGNFLVGAVINHDVLVDRLHRFCGKRSCWIHRRRHGAQRHRGRKRGYRGRYPRPYPLARPSRHHSSSNHDWSEGMIFQWTDWSSKWAERCFISTQCQLNIIWQSIRSCHKVDFNWWMSKQFPSDSITNQIPSDLIGRQQHKTMHPVLCCGIQVRVIGIRGLTVERKRCRGERHHTEWQSFGMKINILIPFNRTDSSLFFYGCKSGHLQNVRLKMGGASCISIPASLCSSIAGVPGATWKHRH